MGKAEDSGIEGLSLDELRQRVKKAKGLIAEIEKLFPGTVMLTTDDRIHSDGRLRAGESEVLGAILAAAESAPQYFASLADRDEGHDAKKFETQLLRERLEQRDLMSELAGEIEPLATRMSDTVLHLGARVRPAALAAYQIAKSVAATDSQLRTRLAPALDFYARPARRAADTRAAHKPPQPAG